MTAEELFAELRRLSRAEKICAIQMLVQELAVEEGEGLTPGARYEIWSPYDTPAAANTLLAMLREEA